MSAYSIRQATLGDAEALAGHRVDMFIDMGVPIDAEALRSTSRTWLDAAMAAGTYHAWVVETETREIGGGGGLIVIPWPPGPGALSDRRAFIYNVYTEPPHRKRGLARLTMDTIHAWCAAKGIDVIALNASPAARHLYESMGYMAPPSPMMVRIG